MDIELHRLKIRHLITQKEAAIAEANMQSAREGWTCDWSIFFHELDRQILAAIEESNTVIDGRPQNSVSMDGGLLQEKP